MPVVVDGSALVELLLQSRRAPAVLQAVGDTEMVAPDGINPEVLSTLRRLERIGELPAARASLAVDHLVGRSGAAPSHAAATAGGVDASGQRQLL